MATITVRDLDERTRDQLRVRAARNGRSMEAEVREILDAAVRAETSDGAGLGSRIRALFADIGFADDLVAAIPPRSGSHRETPFADPS
ncbi:Arc family DNA-binding protein [Herbiconiux sp. P15]|uniref:FitA-like ribbon-helix-helix domain-containing protein n=1 Tax=Herbiconiux liukaitaii TaxID=3342799 RepID=UPI0035B83ECB